MTSSSDGAEFTGAVTVYITGDGGTQAAGSVSSGACTHRGHGYHEYAPAQAETNYDHIAFTFVGSGAITATVQVYTTFPQTGDNYARLGAPAGASVSADIATVAGYVDTEVAAIKAKTDQLTFTVANQVDVNVVDWKGATAPAMTGDAYARLGAPAGLSVSADIATVASYVDTEVAAIKAKTDNLPASPAAVSDIPTAAAIADQVWDELIAGHAVSGSTGEALSAAGAAGDPWITALPGSYSAGQAGYIVGTNLNATVGSRATQTSVDTIDDYIDTEVAAIKAYADRTVCRGTVSGTSPTTTSFTASALSPAGVDADQFKGRIIVFENDTLTTALRGQATDITANTAASNPQFTFSALSRAPQSGDTFSIV